LISALLIFYFSFRLYIASKKRAAIKDWEAVDLKITLAIAGATSGHRFALFLHCFSLNTIASMAIKEYEEYGSTDYEGLFHELVSMLPQPAPRQSKEVR
jgi:hypothetical protein